MITTNHTLLLFHYITFYWLWDVIHTGPPLMNTYCLSISHPTPERGWFGSTLPLLSRNPVETSSCCHLCQGLQTQISGGMAFIPLLFREPFSLITLALLLLSWFPPSSHCYSISAQGYWFSFCGFNLDPDQAQLDQLTLTLIHIKAIWTAKFNSCLHKLTPSMGHYIWQTVLKGKYTVKSHLWMNVAFLKFLKPIRNISILLLVIFSLIKY